MKRIEGDQKRTHAKVSIGLLNRIQYLASLKKLYILITRHVGAYILGHLVGMSYARWKLKLNQNHVTCLNRPACLCHYRNTYTKSNFVGFLGKKTCPGLQQEYYYLHRIWLRFFFAMYSFLYRGVSATCRKRQKKERWRHQWRHRCHFRHCTRITENHILQPRASSWIHTQYSMNKTRQSEMCREHAKFFAYRGGSRFPFPSLFPFSLPSFAP